jgi:hypothetical protein
MGPFKVEAVAAQVGGRGAIVLAVNGWQRGGEWLATACLHVTGFV